MAKNAAYRRLESRQKLIEAMGDYFGACAADDNYSFEDDIADVIFEATNINMEVTPN